MSRGPRYGIQHHQQSMEIMAGLNRFFSLAECGGRNPLEGSWEGAVYLGGCVADTSIPPPVLSVLNSGLGDVLYVSCVLWCSVVGHVCSADLCKATTDCISSCFVT